MSAPDPSSTTDPPVIHPRDLRAGWFAIRRTLPSQSFRENLDELLALARPAGLDEVILMLDPEELNHGHTPVEWFRNYLPLLTEARDKLQAAGIAFSLNPWVTLGHGDRARPALPGIRPMVGHDGIRSTNTPCPFDTVWRSYMQDAWSLLAATRPRVFWVEDDIRFSNHAPVRFGCFCDEHLERFGKLAGHPVPREELVAALLEPGEPHPWRALWLEMQRATGTELAGFIGEIVRAVSPATHLGLMSSGARTHASDHRDWHAFARALGGEQAIVSRPTLGCYDEGWAKPRDLIFSKDSILLTRHVLPPGTPDLTEVEGVHFSPYAQSRLTLGLKIGFSFASGARGVTLNCFDHLGTPMADDPGVMETLAKMKPLARALGEVPAGSISGVRLFFAEDSAVRKELTPGCDFDALVRHGFEAVEMFETHGIATTYDESPVAALCGQSAHSLTDLEIESLLASGLFLDGEAASILCKRGFGAAIGLESISHAVSINDPLVSPCAAERWDGSGDEPGGLLSALLPSFEHNARIHPATAMPAARIVGELLDNDQQPRLPAMIAFENDRGGRVVTQLWQLASTWGHGFKGSVRARQLQWAIRWISRDAPPLITSGGALALGLMREGNGSSLLSCFNLSYDPLPFVRWEFAGSHRPDSISILAPDGTWQPAGDIVLDFNGRRTLLTWPHPLAFGDSIHLRMTL